MTPLEIQRRNLAISLLSFLLISCAKPEQYGQPDPFLESRLTQRMTHDLSLIGKTVSLSGLSFTFYHEPLMSSQGIFRQGLCDSFGHISLKVLTSETELYVNFLHEIGHCKLGKGHDDTHPNIMNSLLDRQVLQAFYDNNEQKLNYLKELFK